MKKYSQLEQCYCCRESKVILKQILFYGRVKYICKECNNLRESQDKVLVTPTWAWAEIYYPFMSNTRH